MAVHEDRCGSRAHRDRAKGWLLLYHGVLRSCNGYVYAFGSALLDLDQPWKIDRPAAVPYLISPREIYELHGRRSERHIPLRVAP